MWNCDVVEKECTQPLMGRFDDGVGCDKLAGARQAAAPGSAQQSGWQFARRGGQRNHVEVAWETGSGSQKLLHYQTRRL